MATAITSLNLYQATIPDSESLAQFRNRLDCMLEGAARGSYKPPRCASHNLSNLATSREVSTTKSVEEDLALLIPSAEKPVPTFNNRTSIAKGPPRILTGLRDEQWCTKFRVNARIEKEARRMERC